MSDLDSILKSSLSQASRHTRKVYSQNPLAVNELVELGNSRVLTIAATVRPDGRPHLSPTDLVVLNEMFYLGVDEATARYRNLQKNPAVTIMLADGSKRQAILEGKATFLDMKSPTANSVLTALKKKYGWVTDHLALFQPTKIFTWKAK